MQSGFNKGFFSYAHADNKDGRLTALCDDLCDEYAMLTGETLDLFFDREKIDWGSRWDEVINAGIDESVFFIPVLTPRYFKSAYCTRELRQFLSKIDIEKRMSPLLLPVYYVNVTESYLNIDSDLVRGVLDYQYEDWTALRFEVRESREYRLAINRMARRIIEEGANLDRIVDAIPSVPHAAPDNTIAADIAETQPPEDVDAVEPPFFVESLAQLEESSARVADEMEEITSVVNEISDVVNSGTESIARNNAKNGGFKGIQVITQSMALKLNPLAERYEQHSNEVMENVMLMDQAIRGARDFYTKNAESGGQQLSKLSELIGPVIEPTKSAKLNLEGYAHAVGAITGVSRSLSKPLRSIEKSTTKCVAACEIILSWEEMIEDAQNALSDSVVSGTSSDEG